MVQIAGGGSMLSVILLEGFYKLCDRMHEAISSVILSIKLFYSIFLRILVKPSV